MEGFNEPGSSTVKEIPEEELKSIVEQQLNNVVSILKGKLEYASTYDNTGKITKKIIITYDETN
jgi:Mor family transcriptional regulator